MRSEDFTDCDPRFTHSRESSRLYEGDMTSSIAGGGSRYGDDGADEPMDEGGDDEVASSTNTLNCAFERDSGVGTLRGGDRSDISSISKSTKRMRRHRSPAPSVMTYPSSGSRRSKRSHQSTAPAASSRHHRLRYHNPAATSSLKEFYSTSGGEPSSSDSDVTLPSRVGSSRTGVNDVSSCSSSEVPALRRKVSGWGGHRRKLLVR